MPTELTNVVIIGLTVKTKISPTWRTYTDLLRNTSST